MIWLLCACLQKIPAELELAPPAASAPEVEPTEPVARAVWMLGGDPLARRVRRPGSAVGGGWDRFFALPPDAGPAEVWKLEAESAGTAAVALARGARLAGAETALDDPGRLLRWLTPLAEPGPVKVEEPRPPLDWLRAREPEAALGVLERATLLGWLDGPGVDRRAAATLLADDAWARLARTPAGRLVRAPLQAGPAPADDALALATGLALAEAAADRPAEHEAVRARRAALGVGASGDGAAELLLRAFDDELARGGELGVARALVAYGALRWRERCPDAPCGGFDRAGQLDAAARHGAAAEAAVWRAIAWKGAVDTLWASWDRPQVTEAMDAVVELVAARSPRALDLSALARPAPGPAWVLPITRALGGPEGTSKEALFRVLNARVADEAEQAAAAAPAYAADLGRVARRARRGG